MLQERILIGGAPGSGKTYAWLTIARNLDKVKFYVIDPDDGTRRVWYSEFPDVKNIEYYFCPTWFTTDYAAFKVKPNITKIDDGYNRMTYKGGVADAWSIIKSKARENDWVVVEHLQLLWNLVQDAFTNEVFDKNIGNYFLEKRKAAVLGVKKSEEFKEWQNWGVIKGLHNNDFVNDVCFDNKAHVFMTTSIGMKQSGEKEDNEVQSFYGDTNLRYEGEKHNPFRVQTHLISKTSGRGNDLEYFLNTFIKDRGREHLVEYKWSDFYMEYLVMIAGWE